MIDKHTVDLLANISLALFRKNFFGIYHGSISSKVDHDSFIINTKDAIFDEIGNKSLCELYMNRKDYRWKVASMEADIHESIYHQIHEAKFIACGTPPYTTSFTFNNDEIVPLDYYGQTALGNIPVYDPGNFDTWYDRNSLEIVRYFRETKSHIMVIKGVGVYVYDRDINELIKKVAILENSCRMLGLKGIFQ